MSTYGPAYERNLDGERIAQQMVRIRNYMMDGSWRTLRAISTRLGYPEASVSAQLRHLRKIKFGSFRVEKRRCGLTGLWEYRVLRPLPQGPGIQLHLTLQ